MSRSRPRPVPQAASPTARQLSRAFFALLMRHRLWIERAAAKLGLSPIQARTLFLMDPKRPSRMSEAALKAGCGPSNLTGIIDKLEARGLVKRRSARNDRRIKMVSVTRAGAALRRRLVARLHEPAPWMLALGADDQRHLLAILRKALASGKATDAAER